jgi:hypothetical protein
LAPVITWLWVLMVVMLILGAVESALDAGGNLMSLWVHRAGSSPG